MQYNETRSMSATSASMRSRLELIFGKEKMNEKINDIQQRVFASDYQHNYQFVGISLEKG